MRANDSTAAAAGLGRGWHLFTVLVYQNSTKVYCGKLKVTMYVRYLVVVLLYTYADAARGSANS